MSVRDSLAQTPKEQRAAAIRRRHCQLELQEFTARRTIDNAAAELRLHFPSELSLEIRRLIVESQPAGFYRGTVWGE